MKWFRVKIFGSFLKKNVPFVVVFPKFFVVLAKNQFFSDLEHFSTFFSNILFFKRFSKQKLASLYCLFIKSGPSISLHQWKQRPELILWPSCRCLHPYLSAADKHQYIEVTFFTIICEASFLSSQIVYIQLSHMIQFLWSLND